MEQTFSKRYLDFIFGKDSVGNTIAERARSSTVKFVRSQDHLAVYTKGATGKIYSAEKALRIFGIYMILEVYEKCSAILPVNRSEPSGTLNRRRIKLGISISELAKKTGLAEELIQDAEDEMKTSSIHVLDKIALALGLDPDFLSFKPDTLLDE